MLQATPLAAIILLMVCSSTYAFPQPAPAPRHDEAAAMAVRHIERAFETAKTTFKALQSKHHQFKTLQSEKCSLGVVAFNATCPAIGMMSDAGAPYSRAFLNSFCPCMTLAKQQEPAYKTLANECEPSFVFSLQMISSTLCTQPAKKDKYCGEDFMKMLNATGGIESGVTSDSSRLALQKTLGTTLCSECFEQIVAGMYSYTGLLQAYTDSTKCNAECRSSAQNMAQMFAPIQMMSNFCAKNDNTAQVAAGDTYCLPWFLYLQKGGSSIAKCGAITTASACGQTTGECIFANNKCYAAQDQAVSGQNNNGPSAAQLTDMCSNTCFSRMTYAALSALMGAFTPAGSSSGNVMDTSSLDQVLSSLNNMCVSNTKGFCISQMSSLGGPPQACEADSKTWESPSTNPTCSAVCAVGVKAYFDNLGCCLGSMVAMNTGGGNPFAVIQSACKVNFPAACDAAASAPVPVTTKISGNCVWLNTNGPANTQYLLNETAKSLGVGTVSLKGFQVMAASGVSCNNVRRHFASQQASTLGLMAKFNVVAANDATAQRIATAANSNTAGITLPAVEKSAAKTTASIQLSGTNPPRILNTEAPATSAPILNQIANQIKTVGSGAHSAAVVSFAGVIMGLIAMLL